MSCGILILFSSFYSVLLSEIRPPSIFCRDVCVLILVVLFEWPGTDSTMALSFQFQKAVVKVNCKILKVYFKDGPFLAPLWIFVFSIYNWLRNFCGSLVSKATALPSEPQPLPTKIFLEALFSKSVFCTSSACARATINTTQTYLRQKFHRKVNVHVNFNWNFSRKSFTSIWI